MPSSIAAFVYDSKKSNLLGHQPGDLCCTYNCSDRTYVFRIPEPDRSALIVNFEANSTIFMNDTDNTIDITHTGTYIFQIVNCQEFNVHFSGTIIAKNPFGYLPGETFMLLPTSAIIALIYLFAIIAYAVLCFIHRKVLMKIQYGILGVLIFSFFDFTCWFFYRLGTNNTGYYNISALIFVIFLANIQRTLVRVLYLVISMGFGIVKWTLGNTKMKVILLAIFSFIFSFMNQTIVEIESIDETRTQFPTIVKLIVSVTYMLLDVGFFYWIILSLIRTIQQLTLRRQVLKLEMYKTFLVVLIIAGVLLLLLLLYNILSKFLVIEPPWQNKWIESVFWQLLFLMVTVTTAFLWRPRENNLRYGYAEFFTKEDEPSEVDNSSELPIVYGPDYETKHRKKSKKENYDTDREKNIQKTKPKFSEFDQGILEFDLASEDEEDQTIENELRKME